MKLTCPNCYETLSLSALIEHDAARDAIKLALEFPAPLGKLILQYASLFKPAQRALSMDRFSSILNALLPMIQAAQIERNGRAWPAPQAYWQQAFEMMWLGREKLTLPLKSHGYLLEIISGFANKAEGQQERKSEQGRKYGSINSPTGAVVGAVNDRDSSGSRSMTAPTKRAAAKKSEMPDEVRKTLKKLTNKPHLTGEIK